MTDTTQASDTTERPYAAPLLTDLGTIGAVTAGPDNGTLDQLGGSSGGWLVGQGTS